MSYAASTTSNAGTIATYAKKMAQYGQPDVEIILDNHFNGKAYTTFDGVSGKVNIKASHNARFDEIKVTFEGCTKTWVESLSPTATKTRSTATHNFLKLVMPVRESDYPQPRIAEAGRTYTFPFNFVIPDQLLPKACSHECTSEHVHQAHIQLPPSLGDREVSRLDDLAPDMSKIVYSIKAKVTQNKDADNQEIVLVEGQKKLLVVPAVAEEPPMSLGDGFDDYVLEKTKSLRKGMFSGKLGRITITAAQTAPFVLPSPSSTSQSPASTIATVNLRFDPHHATSEPPRLGGLTTKIKTSTFFSARATRSFPTRTGMSSQFESERGVYATSTPLSSRCVESVAWTYQEPLPRRNSDSSSTSSCSSTCTTPEPTSYTTVPDCNLENAKGFYTAQIIVPITLPSTKAFPPTFHSCIVSRVYTLSLTLTIHTPSASIPASTATLHLPVQIAAQGNTTHRAAMTPEEARAELADANDFFTPRVLEVPQEEMVGNSVLRGVSELPPSYESFAAAVVVGRS